MNTETLIDELRAVQAAIDGVHKRLGELNTEAISLQTRLAAAEQIKARIVVDLTSVRLEVF